MKGVFEISGNSRYDDAITERYHFPSNYLSVARELVSDWIVYRETRVSGGRMSYIAAAFVERIDADPSDPSRCCLLRFRCALKRVKSMLFMERQGEIRCRLI